MSTRLAPTPIPATPVDSELASYVPDEGMTFSTVRVQQIRDAYVAVEHPAGWSAEDLAAALSRRGSDLVAATQWWDAEATTSIPTATLGEYEPDDPSREPFALSPADLAAPAPVEVSVAGIPAPPPVQQRGMPMNPVEAAVSPRVPVSTILGG